MKNLVNKTLELNEKLVRCTADEKDDLIARVESLLRESTLEDLKEIYSVEKGLAMSDWRHQEFADYYLDAIKIEESLSTEDL